MLYPFSESVRTGLLLALPAALTLLALAVPWIERAGRTDLRRLHTAALGTVVLLAFGVYTNSNWQNRRYFNAYEFFHYHVGAKYFPELGYTRLYDAAVLVDRETGYVPRTREIANLSAHLGGTEYKRRGQVFGEEQAIRAPFDEARWREFVGDVSFFRDELGAAMWEELLRDKGYNPTPVWTLVGRRLAEAFPPTSRAALAPLVALDVLLLLATLGLIVWAFGLRAALFAAGFYLAHYCTSHAHFRAAFLRLDWLFALVASLCFARRKHPAWSGAFLAWSALLRIFPAVFALGPVALLVAGTGEGRAQARRFVLGALLAGLPLLGLSVVDQGAHAWREFGAKIAEHDQRPASDTIGARKLFLWTISYRKDQGRELREDFERRRPAWYALLVAGAVGLGWIARRRPLAEALALGFPFLWLAAAPAYYYYALLLVPLCHFAARAATPGGALGLACVFATGVFARLVHGGRTFDGHFAFKFTFALGVLVLILVWTEAREARREHSVTPASP